MACIHARLGACAWSVLGARARAGSGVGACVHLHVRVCSWLWLCFWARVFRCVHMYGPVCRELCNTIAESVVAGAGRPSRKRSAACAPLALKIIDEAYNVSMRVTIDTAVGVSARFTATCSVPTLRSCVVRVHRIRCT